MMAKGLYWLAFVLLTIAISWLEDDAYNEGLKEGTSNRIDAWNNGFERGVKSVEVLRTT
jgi:hypothetical protein